MNEVNELTWHRRPADERMRVGVTLTEEVIGMFSEALKMMDDNMYQYMADQHMALLKQREAEILEQQTEIQNLYKIIIDQMKQNNDTKEIAVSKLQDTCNLSLEQAEDLIEKNW